VLGPGLTASSPLAADASGVLRGVVVRETVYAAHSRIESHAHPWAFVALVVDGSVEEVCAGVRSARGRGAVRIMPADVEHANAYRSRGARCLVTEIHADASPALSMCDDALTTVGLHSAGSAVSACAERMYAEVRYGDDLSTLAVDGLLRQLLVAAVRSTDRRACSAEPTPGWLRRVRDRLHDEFPRVPTLESLAGEAGVHPSHLSSASVEAHGRRDRPPPARPCTGLRHACGTRSWSRAPADVTSAAGCSGSRRAP
jgi:AraC family transcriptional regulator